MMSASFSSTPYGLGGWLHECPPCVMCLYKLKTKRRNRTKKKYKQTKSKPQSSVHLLIPYIQAFYYSWRCWVACILVFHLSGRKGTADEQVKNFLSFPSHLQFLCWRNGEQQTYVVTCILQSRDSTSILIEPNAASSFPKFISGGDVNGGE